MYIKVGCELTYECPQPTPMLLMLNIHYSHAYEIIKPDLLVVSPNVPISPYRDGFGNWCSRMEAPAGRTTISTTAVVRSKAITEPIVPSARQYPVWELPEDTLVYLLASRYCETDLLTDFAWKQFANTPFGWGRVQAVCLNIPARYCTGYLGDIRIPPVNSPMDFAGWFEAFLGGQWYVFDPRNNTPRIGRVLIARGRDAVDVAISTTFGPNRLVNFTVTSQELPSVEL